MCRSPLSDVMFVLQNQGGKRTISNDAQREDINNVKLPVMSKLDMTITAIEGNDNLGIDISYSTKLFRQETMERLADYLRRLISGLVVNVGQPIGQLQMISDS